MRLFDWMRPALMDEAGGGDGGGGGVAVSEASSDFSSDSGGSGEVHDAEFVDSSTALEPSAPQEQTSPALVKAGERAVQGGKFTQSGKAAIESVRALSPRLAQEMTQALLTRDWFTSQFPGGKREIEQLRQLASETGGQQGVTEMRQALDEWNRLDDLYLNEDPRFLEQITETDEGKKAFLGLMPAALQKFAQLDTPRFEHYISRAFVNMMDQDRLPVAFQRMADILVRAAKYAQAGQHELAASFIGDVAATHDEIVGILGKHYDRAKNAPAVPTAKDPKLDDRARQITEREQQLQSHEWQTAVSGERRRIFSKAWGELTKGRNLTEEQDANIKGFYELRLQSKIRNWQNQAERFFANNDKDGFLREQYAFFQRAIPEALRQAIAQALPAKPGPKPAASRTQQQTRRNATPTQTGAVRVARMPPTSDLDAVRTTARMLTNNQAYTKDGRLVQWG